MRKKGRLQCAACFSIYNILLQLLFDFVFHILTFFFKKKSEVFYDSSSTWSWWFLQVRHVENITNNKQQKVEIQFVTKFGVSDVSRVKHPLKEN